MELGKTSVLYFISRLFASFVGFLATLYIARTLGAGALGVYNLAVGLTAWLSIAGTIGISGAISKRVSEGDYPGHFAVAGAIVIGLLATALAIVIFLFRTQVNAYVGYPASLYIIGFLFASLTWAVLSALLSGLHLVHIQGLLAAIKVLGRSAFQILAIFVGLGTSALFLGHIAGFVIIITIALFVISNSLSKPSMPRAVHFTSLFDFAKFSWLGNLRSRMFNYTDVIVLGFFVSSTLIGVYSIAWNISQVLILFSSSLTATLFPELSNLSAKGRQNAVSNIVEKSLTFGGLFLIPGLLGAAILGDRILRLYGPEFPQGSEVLTILVLANLFMGYQNQLLNTLNAIDRPELAFRVNAVFAVSNLLLNVALIHLYGWIGAAVATATSVLISLVLGYWHVDAIIEFTFPIGEIAKQGIAAICMATIVYAGLYIESTHQIMSHNFATVVVLVVTGAIVYFLLLLGLSKEFRETVDRNLPFTLPLTTP